MIRPRSRLAGAWVGSIESAATIRIHALTPENLTVHEWGVFSTFNDAKYAAADLTDEWATLPEYFYRQFPKPHLGATLNQGLTPVKKPIMYFYTDQPHMNVDVKVAFADAAPFVWWPATSSPAGALAPGTGTFTPPAPATALEWKAELSDNPSATPIRTHRFFGRLTPNNLPAAEPEQPWLALARIKGPAMVMTDAGPVNFLQAPRTMLDSERFIYYDGLTEATDHVAAMTWPPTRSRSRTQLSSPSRI